MSKRIVFFNYYHNGDIHVSRGFIRQIIDKVLSIDPSTQFVYSHVNDPCLLSDITNLGFDSKLLRNVSDHDNLITIGNDIYINTWYAQQRYKFMNTYGITFDCLYAAFNDTCKLLWGFSLEDISNDPSTFFPTIEYNNFQINECKNWLNNHSSKKVFISNGQALSGQSHNFAISPLINNLAIKHTDIIFILSNVEEYKTTLPNIFYSKDIIKKNAFDLNENAYLSEHCDIIMGRANGPFAFSETQKNLFKRKCNFLCFTNLIPKKEGQFWLADLMQDKIKYSCTFAATNESNTNIIQNIIENHLYAT